MECILISLTRPSPLGKFEKNGDPHTGSKIKYHASNRRSNTAYQNAPFQSITMPHHWCQQKKLSYIQKNRTPDADRCMTIALNRCWTTPVPAAHPASFHVISV